MDKVTPHDRTGMSLYLTWLGFLVILVPLSVDQTWNVPLGRYDLRIQYIGAAFLSLLLLFRTLQPGVERDLAKAYIKTGWFWACACLAVSGLIGAFNSVHTTRAAFFWMWSMGTLFGVPLLACFTYRQLGQGFLGLITAYLGVQSLVVVLDFFLCFSSSGALHLGKVMIYSHLNGTLFCRPHAFYQEPGYYCGFALLGASLLQIVLKREKSLNLKKFYQLVFWLAVLGALFSSSRMGWLGVAFLFVLEVGQWFHAWASNREKLSVGQKKNRGIPYKATSLVTLGLLVIAVSTAKYWPVINLYVIQSFRAPKSDLSFDYRWVRARAAQEVFRQNPIFGAGPGAGAAFLVDQISSNPVVANATLEHRKFLREDPLALDLYNELLSEWGVLGFLAYFAGIFAISLKIPFWARVRFLGLLAIIYSATQTLPRFDLWWMIGSTLALHWPKKSDEMGLTKTI